MKRLSIAVLSDLHCHPTRENSNETYLTTDLLRTDSKNHPVENILNLISEEKIKVDFTLCPGDFTDKSDVQGFISGWDFSLEINSGLKGKKLIATVGNHDVDSYQTFSNYSLEIAKGIKKGFPLYEEVARNEFWANGCTFIEEKDFRVLVINSSHYHYSRESSSSGKVGKGLIEYVDQYMKNAKDEKVSICMAHHHPINHDRLELGDDDKIVNGEELLEILGKYRFDMFIHGHKHDALLRYYNCSDHNFRLPIFSSGSFSAISNLSWTGKRNHFHIIELIKEDQTPAFGKIKTWTFMPRKGWQLMYDEGGFHPNTGFGYSGKLEDIVQKIEIQVGDSPLKPWKDIIEKIPEVEYLTPSESDNLYSILREKNLFTSKRICEIPEHISNVNSIAK